MIVIPDIKGRGDGPAQRLMQMLDVDIPILLVSRVDDLEFSDAVLKLQGEKYILVDYIENGWNWDRKDTFIVGRNWHKFKDFTGNGWYKLNEFVKNNQPWLYFKRELLQKDATDWLLPCEYPNWQEPWPQETREQFEARPIDVFNYWGRSHEARLMFHGEIWKHAARKGYTVCDNPYQFNAFMERENGKNKWVSFHMPWYARFDMKEILKVNNAAKLSISLPGAGVKCFRSTGESLVNSIVMLPEDNLAYSYPLVHGTNCIKFDTPSIDGMSQEWRICNAIDHTLHTVDLYPIYCAGLKAADFYRAANYVKYLKGIIEKACA